MASSYHKRRTCASGKRGILLSGNDALLRVRAPLRVHPGRNTLRPPVRSPPPSGEVLRVDVEGDAQVLRRGPGGLDPRDGGHDVLRRRRAHDDLIAEPPLGLQERRLLGLRDAEERRLPRGVEPLRPGGEGGRPSSAPASRPSRGRGASPCGRTAGSRPRGARRVPARRRRRSRSRRPPPRSRAPRGRTSGCRPRRASRRARRVRSPARAAGRCARSRAGRGGGATCRRSGRRRA